MWLPKTHLFERHISFFVTVFFMTFSWKLPSCYIFLCTLWASGVARAFPVGRLTHQEGQNEEENSKVWGKIDHNLRKKNRKLELLPTWGWLRPFSEPIVLYRSIFQRNAIQLDYLPQRSVQTNASNSSDKVV